MKWLVLVLLLITIAVSGCTGECSESLKNGIIKTEQYWTNITNIAKDTGHYDKFSQNLVLVRSYIDDATILYNSGKCKETEDKLLLALRDLGAIFTQIS